MSGTADRLQTYGHRFQRLLPAGALLGLILVVLLAYWPGRTGGFVFDDYPNILNNSALHVTTLDGDSWVSAALSSPARNLPRPLAMLSFAANHYFTGLAPEPLKLTNIAIHLLNTLLVFGLLQSLFNAIPTAHPDNVANRRWIALLVAGCWALHPVNLMAVLFVVQRMESLSHVFVFAGLWLYTAGRQAMKVGRGGWPQVLVALVPMTLAGVLSKESAALLPLYAFCLELFVFRFMARAGVVDRRLHAMFVMLLLVPALLALVWLLPPVLLPDAFATRNFTLAERLMTEPRVVFEYLRWIALPDLATLSIYHDDFPVSRGLMDPASTLPALVGLPIVAGVAWSLRRRRPLAGMGLAWFLSAHLLTATFLPLELVFEHRNYFASLGICILVLDLLAFAPPTRALRRLGAVAGLAAMLILGGLTWLRASEWSSPVRFAITEAAKHPQSPRASYYLGWMLTTASGYEPASDLVDPAFAAFDQARKLPGSNILPDQGALVLAARTGRLLKYEWWQHMQHRLREQPIGPQETGGLAGLVNCAIERKCAFPSEDMLATFGAALSQGPNAEVLSVYANFALNVAGDPDLALRLWQESRALNPGEPEYRISLSKLLIALGREQEAEQEISQLRAMGRFGQFAHRADELQARLEAARASHD